MSNLAETIDYKGHKIKIYFDSGDAVEDPRGNDNLGTMVCFHKRNKYGDDNHGYNSANYGGYEGLKEDILRNNPNAVILPIYMYDHSGQTIKTTPFNDYFDSGQLGFIFVSEEKIAEHTKDWSQSWRDEYHAGKTDREIAEAILEAEVKEYDSFISGEFYRYEAVTGKKEKEIGSCGGFMGSNHETSGLLDYARNEIDCYVEKKEVTVTTTSGT